MSDQCWHIPRPLLSPSSSSATASTTSEDHQQRQSHAQQYVGVMAGAIKTNPNYQLHKTLSSTHSTQVSSNENNSVQGQQNKSLKTSGLEESSPSIANVNSKLAHYNNSSSTLSTSSILTQNNNKHNKINSSTSSNNGSSSKSSTSNNSSIPNKNHDKSGQSNQSTRVGQVINQYHSS